ncbi:MAG TPA: Mur ligase family protein [Leptospiraceae bacterium]|nr:Mur ligase family protein [Leptospiraceae bacterium]HMW07135.1 Mur ligase family protein [Leptospiraceae bacterium]HMX31809.1 Mur ligase family protein [Leptospiraceae bacterium]HMY32548.1 Mur ligase family protein [Leptospiraceae bacterium]HMZ63918.1 Mur ligase family protein [Leptospiraceae bacterium]
MKVNQFLSTLTNLEKTRNFNVFKEYSLEEFKSVMNHFQLLESSRNKLRISIVGTNGKGSTAFLLSQVFSRLEGNSPVGLYTSPHLIVQNERIQVDGIMISDEWIENFLNSFHADDLAKLRNLSYFEFFTLLSVFYFKSKECKTEIYEAGLGGRLDATKLINPEIVVLTKIGLDHTEILGSTEEKILHEKLLISGTNTRFLFTFKQSNKLMEIIKDFCNEKNIGLYVYDKTIQTDYLTFNRDFALFIANEILKTKNKPPLGDTFFNSMHDVPGRMQVLRKNPPLIFDVGHNPSAIPYVLQSLQFLYPNEKNWSVCFGALKDKDVIKILEILTASPIIKKVFQIVGQSWNITTISHKKIKLIQEEDFLDSIPSEAGLILGSFRLYPPVKQNEF